MLTHTQHILPMHHTLQVMCALMELRAGPEQAFAAIRHVHKRVPRDPLQQIFCWCYSEMLAEQKREAPPRPR